MLCCGYDQMSPLKEFLSIDYIHFGGSRINSPTCHPLKEPLRTKKSQAEVLRSCTWLQCPIQCHDRVQHGRGPLCPKNPANFSQWLVLRKSSGGKTWPGSDLWLWLIKPPYRGRSELRTFGVVSISANLNSIWFHCISNLSRSEHQAWSWRRRSAIWIVEIMMHCLESVT